MNISVIFPSMGRLDHLRMALPFVKDQACKIIVVDYSCPQKSGMWAKDYLDLRNVTSVFCPDQQYFNMSKARNAGAKAATTEWLCFTDADALFAPNLIEEIEKAAKPGLIPAFKPAGFVYAGFTCCRKEDWLDAEMYDETATGYGYDDTQFRLKLDALGLHETYLHPSLISHIPHANTLRTANYAEKNTGASWERNKQHLENRLGDFKNRLALLPFVRQWQNQIDPLKSEIEHVLVKELEKFGSDTVRIGRHVFAKPFHCLAEGKRLIAHPVPGYL